jgi:flagellar protein FliO/FliZ
MADGGAMTMDTAWLLKCVFAFAFVMGLMYLLSWGMRKLGVAGQAMLPGGKRRMKIVEFLSLDHRRRLVLVRCDDKEHLIVLGPQGETVVQAGMDIPAGLQIVPEAEKPAEAA